MKKIIKDFKMFPTGSCAFNAELKTEKDGKQLQKELEEEHKKSIKILHIDKKEFIEKFLF